MRGLPLSGPVWHHARYAQVQALARIRRATLVVGPPGSGKSLAIRRAAEAARMSYASYEPGLIQHQARLVGELDYDAYLASLFRVLYERGGLFCVESLASLRPDLQALLVGAAADDRMVFPDAVVRRHPDFVLFAADRAPGEIPPEVREGFFVLEWDYDEQLERDLARHPAWAAYAQRIRRLSRMRELDTPVTTGDVVRGDLLLRDGAGGVEVADQVLFRRLRTEDVVWLLQEAGVFEG